MYRMTTFTRIRTNCNFFLLRSKYDLFSWDFPCSRAARHCVLSRKVYKGRVKFRLRVCGFSKHIDIRKSLQAAIFDQLANRSYAGPTYICLCNANTRHSKHHRPASSGSKYVFNNCQHRAFNPVAIGYYITSIKTIE